MVYDKTIFLTYDESTIIAYIFVIQTRSLKNQLLERDKTNSEDTFETSFFGIVGGEPKAYRLVTATRMSFVALLAKATCVEVTQQLQSFFVNGLLEKSSFQMSCWD